TDAATKGQVDAEAVTRSQADSFLAGGLQAEETARENADTALDGRLSDVEDAIFAPTLTPLTLGDAFYIRQGGEMRRASFSDLAALLAPSPFPVSLMAGTGPVAVSRDGANYFLWQSHGGEWIRWRLEEFTDGDGRTSHTLSATDLVLACEA